MTDERDVANAVAIFKEHQYLNIAAFVDTLYLEVQDGFVYMSMSLVESLKGFDLGRLEKKENGSVHTVTPLDNMIEIAKRISEVPGDALKILDEICVELVQIFQLWKSGQGKEITSDDDL